MESKISAMAEVLKKVVFEATEEFVSKLPQTKEYKELKKLKGLNLLNELKDNYPNFKIVSSKNTREILQILGTEFFRNIDNNIHVIFKAISFIELLEKGEDILIMIDDVRFPNELEFFINIQKLKTTEEKIKYCESVISKLDLKEEADIQADFRTAFGLNKEQLIEHTPLNLIWENIEIELKKVNKYNQITEFDMEGVESIEEFSKITENYTWSDMIKEYGFVKIFRPLLPIDSKKMNLEQIKKSIFNYTGVGGSEIDNIFSIYEESGVEITVENIQKYGYKRARFDHLSETALDEYLHTSFTNFPLETEDNVKNMDEYKDNMTEFLNNNNSNLVLIAFNGAAGSGKGFMSDYSKKIILEGTNLPKKNKVALKK